MYYVYYMYYMSTLHAAGDVRTKGKGQSADKIADKREGFPFLLLTL